MILIPILFTLGLFGLFNIISRQTMSEKYGRDMGRFIYLCIAFFAPLVVGGIIGFIFSKRSKNKPSSLKERYLAPAIPIVYTLVFSTLIMIFSSDDFNSIWWGIYVFKNPVFFLFHFALYFGGFHYIAIVAELMGYTGFVLGIYLSDIFSKADAQNESPMKSKKKYALVFIIPIVFSGIMTRDIINNGLTELRYGESTIGKDLNEYDLYRIAPFKENNGLAKLDKPASLQFTDFENMPRLDGATAAYPVYAAFVEAVYKGLGEYYEENKDSNEKDIYSAFVGSDDYPLNIVKCTKTGTAYERLINGETDIIFVAEPSKAHIEMIEAKGDEFVLTPIGSEAFVFFTNAKNPVGNLSIKQIQDIYSGKITNWKEVGGQNKSILPYQRPENSGSQTVMQNKVMKDISMLTPTEETHAGGMGEIISQVASYKNAKNSLGYSFMYYSSQMVKNNQIKHIAIDGIKPTPENIRNKTYPFTVPVYAVTLKSNSNENVKKFIDWVLSEEGQSLVEKTGYTSIQK